MLSVVNYLLVEIFGQYINIDIWVYNCDFSFSTMVN